MLFEELRLAQTESGDIGPWSGEAGHESRPNWIVQWPEDDGDRFVRVLNGLLSSLGFWDNPFDEEDWNDAAAR